MKRVLLILSIALVAAYWILCQLDWHLDRNTKNVLPKGNLTLFDTDTYQDEGGLIWELQPQQMNVFHQPDKETEPIDNPYSNIDQPPKFDRENPNLKFLCKDDSGGSYEAILQPDGNYLTSGAKQGTYNYGHPEGILGIIKHTFMDAIPHFINSNYK